MIFNRGGLFVTIQLETNNIFYSFDQGNSWKYFSLFSYAYDILSFFKNMIMNIYMLLLKIENSNTSLSQKSIKIAVMQSY
ncbi:LOW QUALITY PROTEIN: hypothetical protein HZS_3853 [Henneguya salminicola]|nr:LOW QUALITY PROTEIN: hypothetical protein HZS_3853 [Henneguya salminicola]